MSATNTPPGDALIQNSATAMERFYRLFSHHESSTGTRILLIVALAIIAHLVVQVVCWISEWIINKSHAEKSRLGFVTHQPKFITLIRLLTNTLTSLVYFFAVGMFLQECGVPLTRYLASASVVGLAISFGSQGLVQDMVIGLTLIFSDTMVVGDMVEIAGTVVVVGRVEEIGLRFTKLINLFNQTIFIPNRTIANVSRFPDGGLFAYADIHLPAGADQAKTVKAVEVVAQGMWRQFNAIILADPSVTPVQSAHESGWDYVRVRFKIWPGQGNLIETVFRQHMVNAMKTFDPNYADWQVAVTYRTLTSL
jgi:small-conductance mechanosensitive channel